MKYKKFKFFPGMNCLEICEYKFTNNKYYITRGICYKADYFHDMFFDPNGAIQNEFFVNSDGDEKLESYLKNKPLITFDRFGDIIGGYGKRL